MDINTFLSDLDNLFASKRFSEVDDFLKDNYNKAVTEQDLNAQITILNEMAGYYREATRFKEAVWCVDQSRKIMDELGMQKTMQYATTLINEANAYRAAGLCEHALECYAQVEEIYKSHIDENDYMYATLYNNKSILYQNIGDYSQAAKCLEKAASIISQYEDARIEEAVTYTNLGATLLKMGEIDKADEQIEKAMKIFGVDEIKDYHYSACLNVLAQIEYFRGKYDKSLKVYDEALKEIESTIGKDNDTYRMILASREEVEAEFSGHDKRNSSEIFDSSDELLSEESENKQSMMSLCREYFEKFGKPMLQEKFGEYINLITVGLAGEGSECFGFDDDFSVDHDCAPGFCMWMDDDLFAKIGGQLNDEYKKLPQEYKGYKTMYTEEGKWRRGAVSTSQFYGRILGGRFEDILLSGEVTSDRLISDLLFRDETVWADVEEWRLATAVNGEIFHKADNGFTKIREKLLSYYPDRIWKMRLSQELANASQAGQYNYGRMMARKEFITAKISLARYEESIIKIIHLINRKYCPYYKWMHKSMKNVTHLPEIYDVLRAVADMPDQRDAWTDYKYDGTVNGDDQIALTMEIIGNIISNKLNELGLSDISDPYLEHHIPYIR